MSQTDDYESGDQQQPDFEVASECGVCGTVIGAVDEDTHRLMQADHVLKEHREQASPALIEQCEEVLSG